MPQRANDQGESAKKRKLGTIASVCAIVAVPITAGTWFFPDIRQLLFGGSSGAQPSPGSSSPSLALKFTDEDGSCLGQMIDFDAVEGDRVRNPLEPYAEVPDGTDLIWDTCDGSFNITGHRTAASVARMGKDNEPNRDDCQRAVARAPDRVDWAYEPNSNSVESGPDGDLGAGSSFCIETSGGLLVQLRITQGPTTRSVPVVETTVWNP
ncbi:hypothetical protein MOQ72_08300 [Saccharopolyspora sp. K220]|uniref:hypothetical protein n=1 Tax=Saccharopolyspora soli TaxID=2926618 RepID=UPI001F5798FC|nr:hypothetical protein [Saccharopolyspora soli]MCI2417423.1 hypothetical protein [Saccharopolyspora soli]